MIASKLFRSLQEFSRSHRLLDVGGTSLVIYEAPST